MKYIRYACTLLILGCLLSLNALSLAKSVTKASNDVLHALTASTDDSVRVIITLNSSISRGLSPELRKSQVKQLQDTTLPKLAAVRFQTGHTFKYFPSISGLISKQDIAALSALPEVASIGLDYPIYKHANEAVGNTGTTLIQSVNGLTGRNVTVAVLDSGVSKNHPALSDSIVVEKCYTGGGLPQFGSCPSNFATSGESAEDEDGHGTNISGIISSNDPNYIGFAPDARLVVIRVLDKNGAGVLSDWIRALEWIYDHRIEYSIDLVNASLGTARAFETHCDAVDDIPNNEIAAAATSVDLLYQVDIPVFASTGNEGHTGMVALPACLEKVIAIGAIYDSNRNREPDTGTYRTVGGVNWPDCFDVNSSPQRVTCFTNSAVMIDLVAPGAILRGPAIEQGSADYRGTSQAAAATTGMAALMLQADPSMKPNTLLTILQSTGSEVIDQRTNLSFKSINAQAVKTVIPPPCDVVSDITTAECIALLKLKQSANIQVWQAMEQPCALSGVTCETGHVVSINLTGSGLSGALDKSISELQALTTLILDNNQLTGKLPDTIADMPNLRVLSAADNRFTGMLETELGKLTGLQSLNLAANSFEGSIPPEFVGMASLTSVTLSGNQLNGSIPKEWCAGLPLLNNTADFGYNSLVESDICVNRFDEDWKLTQTIPPVPIMPSLRDATSVAINWSVIPYVQDAGWYEVKYATTPTAAAWSDGCKTTTKSDAGCVTEGLELRTTYYFMIQTYTAAHTGQPNNLLSVQSLVVPITTGVEPPPLVAPVFEATQDTFVSCSRPNGNSGDDRAMFIGTYQDFTLDNDPIFYWSRALIAFESFDLPAGAAVASASVRVWHYATNDFHLPIVVDRITGDWNEIDAKWGSLDCASGYGGPTFAGQSYGQASFQTHNSNTDPLQRTIPVTDLTLIEALSTSNNGIMLRNPTGSENQPGVVICSKDEQGLCQASMSPKLVVEYEGNRRPIEATNPVPADNATDVAAIPVQLAWTIPGEPDGDLVFGEVYIREKGILEFSPVELGSPDNISAFVAKYDTTYEWYVTVRDEHGAGSEGDLWTFTTQDNASGFCTTVTEISQEECAVLVSLYYGTGGTNGIGEATGGWTNDAGWMENTTPCTGWFGVTCTAGKISGLTLPDNNLTGTIPPTINALQGLTTLVLSSNRLGGGLPSTIGNLKNLSILKIDHNNLTGAIPASIVTLPGLVQVDLGYNGLYAPEVEVVNFITALDSDWLETQTLPPYSIEPTVIRRDRITFGWTPILYTEDSGYYEVLYAQQPSGPFTSGCATGSKLTAECTVSGLQAGTRYYFQVRSRTLPHVGQLNDILSITSDVLGVQTAPSSSELDGMPPVTALPDVSTGTTLDDSPEIQLPDKTSCPYDINATSGSGISGKKIVSGGSTLAGKNPKTIRAHTNGSRFQTKLHIYEALPGTVSSEYLTEIGCDTADNTRAVADYAQVVFTMREDRDYFIVVTGVNGAYGDYVLSIELADTPPLTLLTPSIGEILTTRKPTFSWVGAPNAQQYKLKLVDSTGKTQTIPLSAAEVLCVDQLCSFTLGDLGKLPKKLENNRSYRWSVTASIPGSPTLKSMEHAFEVAVLQKPELVTPYHDETLTTLTPVFVWKETTGATAYELHVDLNKGSAGDVPVYNQVFLAVDVCVNGLCQVDTTPLWSLESVIKFGKNYKWWVKARNELDTRGSERHFFDVQVIPAAVLIAPVDNTVEHTNTPTFSWNEVADASRYMLNVRGTTTKDKFSRTFEAVNICAAGVCSVNLSTVSGDGFLSNGDYKWRIVAAVDADSTSPRSKTQFLRFTVDSPGQPVIISPVQGEKLDTAFTVFHWSSVANAESYTVTLKPANGKAVKFTYPKSALCGENSCLLNLAALPDANTYPLNDATDYSWSVKAERENSISKTEQWTFKTRILIAPEFISPVANASIDSAAPFFQWKQVKMADQYLLKIQGATTFERAFAAEVICADGVCIVDLAALPDGTNFTLNNGTHKWQVTAVMTTNGRKEKTIKVPFTVAAALPLSNGRGQ